MKHIPQIEITRLFETKILPRTLKVGDCILFRGCTSGFGHGRVNYNYKPILVHRIAYAYYNNTNNLLDLCVLHSCDNPSCIANEHLRLGTRADNSLDRSIRDRSNGKLSKQQVIDIYKSEKSLEMLATEYGVHISHISYIKVGKVGRIYTQDLGIAGRASTYNQLSKELIKYIYQSSTRATQLAAELGITRQTVNAIRSKRRQKEFTDQLDLLITL